MNYNSAGHSRVLGQWPKNLVWATKIFFQWPKIIFSDPKGPSEAKDRLSEAREYARGVQGNAP